MGAPTFIARASRYYDSTSTTTIDTTVGLDIQAGDFLFFSGEWATLLTCTFGDTDGTTNMGTSLGWNYNGSSSYVFQVGYKAQATAKTGALFRMTMSSAVTTARFFVEQWRPASGQTLTLDGSAGSSPVGNRATSVSVLSDARNITGEALAFAFGVHSGADVTRTVPLLGGVTPTTTMLQSGSSPWMWLMSAYIPAAVTAATASMTLSAARAWGITYYAFLISGTSTTEQPATCDAISVTVEVGEVAGYQEQVVNTNDLSMGGGTGSTRVAFGWVRQ